MVVLCRMVARRSDDLKRIAFPLVSLLTVSLHTPSISRDYLSTISFSETHVNYVKKFRMSCEFFSDF
jgi:hypothetical protein